MTNRIETLLSGRLGMNDIHAVLEWMNESRVNSDELIETALTDRGRRGGNALWCLTHVGKSHHPLLLSNQDRFIDRLLTDPPVPHKRMLLQLLREQTFTPDSIRTDFLDYCLSKINAESEPYAIRCFCLYNAYKMCRHFPELMTELNERLELLSLQQLSPGLRCALRKVTSEMNR